ncbi:amidohydrolase [Colletotrichum graminicola M1.001]|uniref:Peptidase M20 domain-containing protein 2 n=1 Tax=Colletotrichum graminicola (strain M1.001 / M2 / FGSC 10212) TaxID=645133 RepID=E3Q230_COLGM|nr:amidohydrolase [Colletotrichum graminicola M1.001]EFQ25131.1 amidohydrolase [Colletotrichum graminicola M1.001]
MTPTEDDGDDFVLISHADAHPYPPAGPSSSPEYLDEISAIVDDLAKSLWPVNKTIHDNPELGYHEVIAHDTLTAFMRTQPGWKVTPSAYGMETAWVAVWDSGKKGPVVSFNAEMDCLPDIGHACGHNLIAMASLAGALAAATLLARHRLPGKVVLFGTPAEEGGGGKIRLLGAGAYADHGVDLNLISHPGIVADTAMMRTTLGREAHAAANPWLGVNALDALVTAYNAVSVLRQQTMARATSSRGHITHGRAPGPNIIHAYAAGSFVVRADTRARLAELRAKVDRCFAAGAEATGAALRLTPTMAYMDHVPNRVLARSYVRHFNALVPDAAAAIPLDQDIDEIRGRTMASTDQGDVSHAMPSLNVGFAIPPGEGGQGPHNPKFAESAGTRVAFENSLRSGKGLAGVAIDVFTQKGMLEEVKRAWRKDMGK